MKRITLSVLCLFFCGMASVQFAVAQTAPQLKIKADSGRPCFNNVQDHANYVIETMPSTHWNDHANTDWYAEAQSEFTLSTAEELAGLSKLVNEGKSMADKTINLGADIDFKAHRFTPIGAKNETPFSGKFNGNGHKLSNVKIVEPALSYVGFFGQTNKASIANVHIENSTIIGSSNVGSLVSNVYNYSSIENCHGYSNEIFCAPFETEFGGAAAGGLAGALLDFSVADRCSVSQTQIYSVSQSGIFTSQAYNNCTVSNSFTSESSVSADLGKVGGFVGVNLAFFPGTNSNFTNCYTFRCLASVRDGGDAAVLGGFIGEVMANITIKNCYSYTELRGGMLHGGFVGRSKGQEAFCVYENCHYNLDEVNDTPAVGDGAELPTITGHKDEFMRSEAFTTLINGSLSPAPYARSADVQYGYPYAAVNMPGGVTSTSAVLASSKLNAWTSPGTLHIVADIQGTAIVYSMDGSIVLKQEIDSNETEIAVSLPKGTYLLSLAGNTCKFVQR